MGGRVPAFAFEPIEKAVILFIFASGIWFDSDKIQNHNDEKAMSASPF